jgi:hypothetical protein
MDVDPTGGLNTGASTALVQALTPSHIVVDLVDDQRLFPGNEGQRTVITEQYQQFIELGHRVMSNSAGLVETLGAEFGRTLEHLPNARFLGTLGYTQAQGVMAQFEVAIVPFVADALVKSMSPIKLDDYARLALPTVVLDPQNKKGFEPALLEALKGQ